jgi:hypothetical protein
MPAPTTKRSNAESASRERSRRMPYKSDAGGASSTGLRAGTLSRARALDPIAHSIDAPVWRPQVHDDFSY